MGTQGNPKNGIEIEKIPSLKLLLFSLSGYFSHRWDSGGANAPVLCQANQNSDQRGDLWGSKWSLANPVTALVILVEQAHEQSCKPLSCFQMCCCLILLQEAEVCCLFYSLYPFLLPLLILLPDSTTLYNLSYPENPAITVSHCSCCNLWPWWKRG